MYSLRFAAHSEVGRVRKNNQDGGYASPNLLMVADGMGGAAAGDLASAVAATEAARSDHRTLDPEEMLERIAGMVARANSKLTDLIDEDLELDGMGTTFCGAMFNGEQFGIAHVGDSRGYLLRDGTLTQLTHDHSWVQSLIDEGKITPQQAATHPHRSLILKVLNGQVNFEPDLELIDAQLGDRIMFCSDGLSGLISEDQILQSMQLDDADEAIAEMARAANAAGGHDNITVIIGDVVEQDDDLDAAPGMLVGSANEVEIPRTGQLAQAKGTVDKHPPYPPTSNDTPIEHDETEVARYAPQESKHRWPGILSLIVAVALVIGGSVWGVQAYAKTRYFVSADEGVVAIYNGLPGSFLGVGFATIAERTDTRVSDLPRFYQQQVESAITVSSLEAGRATTAQLAARAAECIQTREDRNKPTPTPSPSPSPTASPTTGPGLPTATTGPGPGIVPGLPSVPAATHTYLFPQPAPSPSPSESSTPTADPEDC